MKLEIGRVYETRDGRKVRVLEFKRPHSAPPEIAPLAYCEFLDKNEQLASHIWLNADGSSDTHIPGLVLVKETSHQGKLP